MVITKVVMPQLSLSMSFGIVTQWYKDVGDYVEEGEPLCVIEGDKATVDVEAPVSGYLKKTTATLGEEFPVKQVMAYIGGQDDVVDEEIETASERGETQETASQPTRAATSSQTAKGAGGFKASPIAKRLAAEHGIDLSTIQGTGPGGRITRDDVLAAKESPGEAGQDSASESPIPGTTIEITGIKKLVAERMQQSYLDAPHIHLSTTCDVSEVVRMREEVNSRAQDGSRLTFTDVLLWSVSRALEKHRLLNATIKDNSIILLDEINIGVAVATDKGLIVPNIRKVNSLSLAEIASARDALVERAKDGKQTPDDLARGTFTVTNLGMYDVDFFDPIITPGQSAILATGRIRQEISVDDTGEVVETPTMIMTLACDHRIVDGVDGARFLSGLKEIIENPASMFEAS
jgi:pyruvate dehydrogenase E2 component (dihydrolipoamide acetyltransferase)